MPATYDQASATATDQPAFSNGTDGELWMCAWCDVCIHDRAGRAGTGEGCPLVLIALLGRTPMEWRRDGDAYECTDFSPESDGGPDPDEPTPIPVVDGQVDLFEMLADAAIEDIQAMGTTAPVSR